MTLDNVKAQYARLSPWARVAGVGADNSPDTAFIAVCPQQALFVEMYAAKGQRSWRA